MRTLYSCLGRPEWTAVMMVAWLVCATGHANQLAPNLVLDVPASVTIFVIDHSGSQAGKAASPTTRAAIEHYCMVAQLARYRPAFGAVLFRSEQDRVENIGDAEGRLTTNAGAFLRELEKAALEPAGVSPIDLALEKVHELLRDLPDDVPVTVVLLSDGQPRHARLRPELSPELNNQLEATRNRRASEGNSPGFVDAQMQLILQGKGVDGQRLFELQDRLQFDRCCELARSLQQRNARFLAISDQPYQKLAELHAAGGGGENDRIVVPNDRTLEAIRKLKLTEFPLVLSDEHAIAPEQRTEVTVEILLDGMAQRGVATLTFPPVTDFDQNFLVTAGVGDNLVEVRQDNPDESARVLTDTSGKAVGILLSIDGVTPENRTLTIDIAMRSGATSVPAMTVYVDMQVRDDIRFMLKPTNVSAKQLPPYQVEPDVPLTWETYFVDEAGERLLVADMAGRFVAARDERSHELELADKEGEEGLFVSVKLPLNEGAYNAEIWVETLDGHEFRLPLMHHVDAIRQRISLLVTPSFADGDSAPGKLTIDRARRTVAWGTIGDAVERLEHTYFVGLVGADQPVGVAIRCTGVLDQADTPITVPWIRPTQTRLVLTPGKVARLRWICELPDQFDAPVVDGPITFQMQFVREDTGSELMVATGEYEAEIEDVGRAVVYLKRPAIHLSTRQVRSPRQAPLPLRKPLVHRILPVDLPLAYEIPIWVRTDSVLVRTVRLPAEVELQDARSGSSLVGLSMVRTFPEEPLVEVRPGESALVKYRVHLPAGNELSFAGEMRVGGDRLIAAVLGIEGTLPSTRLAPKVRALLHGTVVGLGTLVLLLVVRLLRSRAWLPGQPIVLTNSPDRVTGLRVERSTPPRLRIEGDSDFAYEWKRSTDRGWSPMRTGAMVDSRTLAQQRLQIARIDDASLDEGQPHDLIVRLDRAFLGGTAGLEVEGTVVQALAFERRWTRRACWLAFTALAGGAVFALAIFLRSQAGIVALQQSTDTWPQLHAAFQWVPDGFPPATAHREPLRGGGGHE
ncbi:MAG: hypothetical protein AB7O38_03915 [Pirellulaceae bacterium]